MAAREKDAVKERFQRGEIQVLDLRARSGTTLLLPPTGFSWYA